MLSQNQEAAERYSPETALNLLRTKDILKYLLLISFIPLILWQWSIYGLTNFSQQISSYTVKFGYLKEISVYLTHK